jgi:hypothetical protein
MDEMKGREEELDGWVKGFEPRMAGMTDGGD